MRWSAGQEEGEVPTKLGSVQVTGRGFRRIEFKDGNGDACSIQESSAAEDSFIWLGCDEGTHHHVTGECLARMHLTQQHAAELIPILQHFAKTGKMPDTLRKVKPKRKSK